ncbi:MAG: hypothetical protein HOE90_05580 [Bacteriovoracaceae bacterium]|jgi:hypothetical protein|nr:hypothetical protein [Bacteriovoracaceae bacterium]
METITETIVLDNIVLKEITSETKQMPVGSSFLKLDENGNLKPAFAPEITGIFLVMNWPIFSKMNENDYEGDGISLYGALMPHGKTFVVECFFAEESTGKYLGTHKVFSVTFPENTYLKDYDDWLMDELAARTLGIRDQDSLAHKLML